MSDFPPNNPNMPNQPTKPSDLSPNVVAHSPPVIPTLTHGLTPNKSAPTSQISPHFAATLGLNPNEAAATSTNVAPIGPSPIDVPPLNKQIDGSISSQTLAHAVLKSGESRLPLPAASVPLAATNDAPISGQPNPALPSSSLQFVPRMAHDLSPC
ncbi:hypothetical protein Adt_39640 [Abeliophyllum distichum]|uniref:Uncharacterized protein n=1 Tax=Abeliophyllum distichum TaxID=126358 RepID=A0ABD1Q8S4_9LAMI